MRTLLPILLLAACGSEEPEPEPADDTGEPPILDTVGDDPCLAEATTVVFRHDAAASSGDRSLADLKRLEDGGVLVLTRDGPGQAVEVLVDLANVTRTLEIRPRLYDPVTGAGYLVPRETPLLASVRPQVPTDACDGQIPLKLPVALPDPAPWTEACGAEARLQLALFTQDGVDLGRHAVDVELQPDPCDCAWCSETEVTPECRYDDLDGPYYDPAWIPTCERP